MNGTTRRNLLLGTASSGLGVLSASMGFGLLASAACGSRTDLDPDPDVCPEGPMPGVKPWHMWGTEATADIVIPNTIGGTTTTPQQLAQIIYKRPETWSFFFSATLFNYNDNGLAPASRIINLLWDLQLGLGRNTQVIPAFVRFDWQLGTTGGPENGVQRWTAAARAPAFALTDTNAPALVTQLAAQNIQVSTRIVGANGGNGYSFKMITAAAFAPCTHIRPEWFTAAHGDHTRYPGEETGGK